MAVMEDGILCQRGWSQSKAENAQILAAWYPVLQLYWASYRSAWVPSFCKGKSSSVWWSCLTVLVNNYQVNRIWTHPGNRPLGMSVKEFLDGVDWERKTHPECRKHHSLGWGLGLNRKEKVGWTPVVMLYDQLPHAPATFPTVVVWVRMAPHGLIDLNAELPGKGTIWKDSKG